VPFLVELNRPDRPGVAVTALRLSIHAALARPADVTVGVLEILAADPRRLLFLGLFHGVLPVACDLGDLDTEAREQAMCHRGSARATMPIRIGAARAALRFR